MCQGFVQTWVVCEKSFITDVFSKKNRKYGIIACLHQKSFLSLCAVLLYRLTGKLINYYRKPSKLQIVQWRATPSGSFREPVDYKGQEPSNLVFSEFRRSTLYSKTFLLYKYRLADGKPIFVWSDIFSVICCFSLRSRMELLQRRRFSSCP